MFRSHPAKNGSPPFQLQPSRPMYFGCDGHIQSKMLELQPSSHVCEKSGAICKIHAKYSARAARLLAVQIRKSPAESHPGSHPCKFQRTIHISVTSRGHICEKFRGQSSHPSKISLPAGGPLGPSVWPLARLRGRPRVILWFTCAPPVEFCEVDPIQTESLACKIARICLYLRAHARALRHMRFFSHMHAI